MLNNRFRYAIFVPNSFLYPSVFKHLYQNVRVDDSIVGCTVSLKRLSIPPAGAVESGQHCMRFVNGSVEAVPRSLVCRSARLSYEECHMLS